MTIIIQAGTLGYLNLQFFYGSVIRKGQSRFIGPLTWDPIIVPFDENALILKAIVLGIDFVLLTLGVALLALMAFIVFTFLSFATDPQGTLKMYQSAIGDFNYIRDLFQTVYPKVPIPL